MKANADASVVVSAFVEEVSSQAARTWLSALDSGELMSSWWCVTEVASALAAKARRLESPPNHARRYVDAARALLTGSAIVIDVEQRHFVSAAELLTRCGSPLRASDALHLAVASHFGATLCTLDRRMAEAGHALELDVLLVR